MSKILTNPNPGAYEIADCGVTVAGSSSYTLSPQEYPLFAASSDVIVAIASGALILNDGGNDVTDVSDAVDIIKGWGMPLNAAQQIFFSPDAVLTFTFLDQGLSTQRLSTIAYNSATVLPTLTATKTFNWTLDVPSGKYILASISLAVA